MRLDGFISRATGLSRREAQRNIKDGRVTLGGQIARNFATPVGDVPITLDGNRLKLPSPIYLMLHKPAGYLCANTDGQHPTVLDLLPSRLHPTEPLQIVGRLDLDTTGLLLLTTDGAWNHRITAPSSQCTKVYHALLAEPIAADAIAALARGVTLRSETKPTLPCHVEQAGDCEVRITLQEGRYHQVKRMFAAVSNRVVSLHREQVGELPLDPELKPGEFRHLTESETRCACR
jgi:16S rRNA pseudouridine516 synthase